MKIIRIIKYTILSNWFYIPIPFIIFYIYTPLLISLYDSISNNNIVSNYYNVINHEFFISIIRSIYLGLCVGLTSSFLALISIITIKKKHSLQNKINDNISYPLLGAPDIILAIAWLIWFTKVHIPLGFTALWIAHSSICFPFSLRILTAQIHRLSPIILEAARDLGAKENYIILKIIIPFLKPAIYHSIALSFLFSVDDIVISEFLTTPCYQTLSIYLQNTMKLANIEYSASIITTLNLLFLLISISIYFINKNSKIIRQRKFIKRYSLYTLSFITFILLYFRFYKKNDEKLIIFTLPGYLNSESLKQFYKKYKIKTEIHTFSSTNEIIYKLTYNKSAKCDLILASGNQLNQFWKNNLVDNFRNEDFLKITEQIEDFYLKNPYDHNKYFIPYVWGTTCIATRRGYKNHNNINMSWKDLLNTKNAKILLIDDPKEITSVVDLLSKTNNLPSLKNNKADILNFMNIATLWADEHIEDLFINNQVDIGMIWNGSAVKANLTSCKIDLIWPKEGPILWLDGFMCPKNCKNPAHVKLFIEYCFEEDFTKSFIKSTCFSTVNKKSQEIIKELGTPYYSLYNFSNRLRTNNFYWMNTSDINNINNEEFMWMKYGIEYKDK